MQKRVAVLAIGSEILDGRVLDTNSNYIAEAFSNFGIHLAQVVTCDDRQDQIVSALVHLSKLAKIVIVSGGLGPTTDDLTREAIAEFCRDQLVLNEHALNELKQLYHQRKRAFDTANTKQAYFPSRAKVVPNPVGTAPGFEIESQEGVLIFALPGVPSELRRMFEESVVTRSLDRLQIAENERLEVSTLRIFGLPESIIGARVQSLKIDQRIYISYRAHFPDITVQLKLAGNSALLAQSSKMCREAIGEEFVFSSDPKDNLEQVCARLLAQRKLTLSVAESCTAGMLGAFITNVAGASQYFLGGIQSYSNEAKSAQLGVSANLITKHGAVSKEVACAMADGARDIFKTDLALSITGIAGPDGGSALKPVGTFMVALATPQGTTALHYFLSSSRTRVREYAAWTALDTLRRYLVALPFREEFKDPSINAR